MPRWPAVTAALLGVLALGACGAQKAATPVSESNCEALFYEGEGRPDVIVVSDFPRRGFHRETTTPMVDAIKLVLRSRAFRAGDFRVGYQSCDDTVGDDVDEAACASNARGYVAAKDVLGVIGTYNSGCALAMLPILSRRSAGPLVMVSPSNTYAGLTRPGAGVCCGHPGVLYPDGLRNYARLVAPDDVQGAAAAVAARQRGARSAVVLVQRTEDYAVALGASFVRAARAQGMDVRSMDYAAQPSFEELAGRVAARAPDAVYIAGLPNANGRELVEALRAALGKDLVLVASDAFLGVAGDLGPVGDGLLVTHAGLPVERLPAAGDRFVRGLGVPLEELRDKWVPESGQAAEVLLDAIGRSDGTRASVVERLLATHVEGGILGSFRFDPRGDVDPATYTVYRFAGGRAELVGTVPVSAKLSR